MKAELRRRVLVELNGRRVDYPTDRTIIHLIEEQSRSTPHRVALMWGEHRVQYAELLDLAAAWAGRLRAEGLSRGDFVPVVTDGGPGLTVAILAAMKLGAPFVPVDARWPPQRVRDSLAALRPPVVVATGDCAELGLPLLRVDATMASPTGQPLVREAVPTADDVIYGFFTSGSTGTPKCALNLHRGLLNRFLYMTRRFGAQHDVVLQNSRHVFDSSLWQLLWPLTKGSRVVLPEREGILDLERTVAEIARYGVTMTDFVPSVFNTLVELLAADASLVPKLASLRHLLIGGEEINPRAVRTFRSLLPHVVITNTFGPTECSIGCVFHEVSDADAEAIPIGRPIDNTYVALLDDHREPVPPGQIGEIHLGGDCLGAGYLNDPERTAAAFVPNHLPEVPGPVLYRSGDLAFQREDGLLVFVGRRDQQVKVGGARLELLEVEAAVTTHPAVREAKCVVYGSDDQRGLACYVVTSAAVTARELAEHARGVLPAYAVPRRFLMVDRFPLTPNGKADRRALARMVAEQPLPRTADEPLTPDEESLRELWAELLATNSAGIGPDQDFHELGGTSLTLQRLAAAVRETFGVRLPLRSLAAATTVREQAALLRAQAPGSESLAHRRLLLDDVEAAARITAGIQLGPPSAAPRHVLLTGATGFLGRYLLAELLESAGITVHCLVRAEGPDEGRRRIDESFGRSSAARDEGRLEVVAGELGRPRLGLSDRAWHRLAETVDTVVHAGALVNLLLGYRVLRGANVRGTAEILRLAVTGRAKHIHHVSTVAVFPEEGGSLPVLEQDEPWDAWPAHGYGQSKWVAEKMLLAARSSGLTCTVHRLGEVMPHSRTGRGNPRSVLDRMLRACLRLGLRFPTDAVTDWTPVDDAAKVLVAALDLDACHNDNLQVIRPGAVRLDAVLAELSIRVPLREVDYPEFCRSVRERAERGDAELGALLAVLPEPPEDGGAEVRQLFGDATGRFSSKRAADLARARGLDWAPVDEAVLRAYARELTR